MRVRQTRDTNIQDDAIVSQPYPSALQRHTCVSRVSDLYNTSFKVSHLHTHLKLFKL